MQSRQARFNELISELGRLTEKPDLDELIPLEERRKQLDGEMRSVTDKFERYDLGKLSQEAHALLTAAHQRSVIARDVADTAHERAQHDALHPNILSPRSPERDDPWDWFDR